MARPSQSLSRRTRSVLRSAVETLERRSYLTTLVAGDTFYFADDEGELVRIIVSGAGTVVDLIGANFRAEQDDLPEGVDPAQTAELGDIPGIILNEETGFTPVLGGIRGPAAEDDPILSGLWGIYVRGSTPQTSIIFTRYGEDDGVPSVPLPYAAPTDIQLTEDDSVELGSSSGGVFLGLRTEDGFIIPTRSADELTDPPIPLRGDIQPQILVDGPIGNFQFGGTITGSAFFNGNVGRFYAGNVLTGDIGGLPFRAANDNFSVAGDVGQFIVNGFVGTGIPSGDFSYINGTEIAVSGRIGTMLISDDFRAQLDVVGVVSRNPVSASVREIESRTIPTGVNNAFLQGLLATGRVTNDSLSTAQPLFAGTVAGRGNRTSLVGSINTSTTVNDVVDYYSVPLLAGQSMVVQVQALTSSDLAPNVGVFDPRGRLIASDRSNGTLDRDNQAFRIIADKPGIYVIAVGPSYDLDFNGVADDGLARSPALYNYALGVSRASEAGLGGMQVNGQFYVENGRLTGQPGIRVRNGDIGMLATIAEIGGGGTVQAGFGNLRAIRGGNVGFEIDGALTTLGTLDVPFGSVGHLHATSGHLNVNPFAILVTGNPDEGAAIGGDYQMIEAAGPVLGNYTTNRGIGVVRGGSIGSPGAGTPSFFANVDRTGDDGFIDLIDTTGDFGFFGAGPSIDAGPGGNVRYIRVGGAAYRDPFFGVGLPEQTVYDVGQVARIVDDSGTVLTVTPLRVANRAITPNPIIDSQVTITTLPMRHGGSVILNLTTTGSINIEAGTNRGRLSGAEIGTLNVSGTSSLLPTLFTDNAVRGLLPITTLRPIDITVRGRRPVDIFEVVGINPTTNHITSLTNDTGEIVNATFDDIGTLRARQIGFASSFSGVAVEGLNVIAGGNTYPFLDQRTGIVLQSSADVRAWDGLGNIIASGTIPGGGILQSVRANDDGRFTPRLNEGIAGPVVATSTNPIDGQIRYVNIGEGISPGGTGNFSTGGLFATGVIDTVENQGPGTDIRGDIISFAAVLTINLNGGSIIDAEIGSGVPFTNASEVELSTVPAAGGGTIGTPVYDIEGINIDNGGGIIGSDISGGDIGAISIEGFGIINSTITSAGAGTFDGIDTTGLGIRGSAITGGANINDIIARGRTGRLLDLRTFTPSVRHSETAAFDPYTGISINPSNDLHAYLGTGKRVPTRSGITNEGLIRDSNITGTRTLSRLEAFQIDYSAAQFAGFRPTDPIFPMRISLGDTIGKITTHGSIAGLRLTAGKLGNLVVGGEVATTLINTSGRIGNVAINRSFRGTSSITASGPDGVIESVRVSGSLFGKLVANRIGEIRVGADLGSGRVRSFGSIGTLSVGDDILTGAYVRASGAIKRLIVGDSIEAGATVRASSFSNQVIGGVVAGDIVVG